MRNSITILKKRSFIKLLKSKPFWPKRNSMLYSISHSSLHEGRKQRLLWMSKDRVCRAQYTRGHPTSFSWIAREITKGSTIIKIHYRTQSELYHSVKNNIISSRSLITHLDLIQGTMVDKVLRPITRAQLVELTRMSRKHLLERNVRPLAK